MLLGTHLSTGPSLESYQLPGCSELQGPFLPAEGRGQVSGTPFGSFLILHGTTPVSAYV